MSVEGSDPQRREGKKSQKVSDSHRNDVSPLTQGLRYRAACDDAFWWHSHSLYGLVKKNSNLPPLAPKIWKFALWPMATLKSHNSRTVKDTCKIFAGGTCHMISRMRNDDLALCLWAHDVWSTIYRNPLKIETWVQWTTNRKWPIAIRMVTWLMTSRDLER